MPSTKIEIDIEAVTRLAAAGLTQPKTADALHVSYYVIKGRSDVRAAWRKGHDIYRGKAAAETNGVQQLKTISEIVKEARAAGLTYGQFVAGGNTNVF